MAWKTPKTDWVASDYVNYSDYGRIVGNIAILKNLHDRLLPAITLESVPSSKSYTGVPYASEINAIENNIHAINTDSYNLSIGNKATYSINGNTPLWSEWNRIESAILALYERLNAQIANNTAPTVTITSTTGDWAQSMEYTLTGHVAANGNGVYQVRVYYKDYYGHNTYKILSNIDSGGNFRTVLPLAGGVNYFTIRATDNDKNPSAIQFTKKGDNIAPTLTITQPASTSSSSPTYTGNSSYTVSGTVSDSESGVASVTVNGHTATRSGSSWSYTLTNLSNTGTTTVTVVATDNAGNKTTLVRYLRYDATAPSISITSSSANTPTKAYTLTGSVADAASGLQSVSINGVAVSLGSGGTFSKAFTLSEGNNTFTVSATDKVGKTVSKSITVKCMNQQSNSSYNWSNRRKNGDSKHYTNQVYINGTWYTYYQYAFNEAGYDHDAGGYGHTDADVGIGTDNALYYIPLPKGIKSASFSGHACRKLYIYDGSTGGNIATGSNSVSANFSTTQSMHNLYIGIRASDYNYSYQYAEASCGIDSFSFTYY